MTEQAPEKNIVIIEDQTELLKYIIPVIESLGWTIVKQASTYREAMDLIPKLESLEVSYALVDGNLSPGLADNDEGEKLANLIRMNAPSVKSIGFQSLGEIEGVDIPMGKFHSDKLWDILRD